MARRGAFLRFVLRDETQTRRKQATLQGPSPTSDMCDKAQRSKALSCMLSLKPYLAERGGRKIRCTAQRRLAKDVPAASCAA
eukprot:4677478-Prymnesium_polylepis.1